MSKRRKPSLITDVDSILQDYRCSFVSASKANLKESQKKYQDTEFKTPFTGNEIKSFYENLYIEPKKRLVEPNDTNLQFNRKRNINSSPYNSELSFEVAIKQEFSTDIIHNETDPLAVRRLVKDLLSAASSGSKTRVKKCMHNILCHPEHHAIINGVDEFGWNAVMCAAAEGYLNVVQYLIKKGCSYKNVVDNSGMNLFKLCELKNQYGIYIYLTELENRERVDSKLGVSSSDDLKNIVCIEENNTVLTCQLCSVNYKYCERSKHESSVTHIFNDKNKTVKNIYGISSNNVGFQMMLKNGWTSDVGLGPRGLGRMNPIKTINKQDRYGLGLIDSTTKKRVSHFSSNDSNAIKQQKVHALKEFSKKSYDKKRIKDKQWEMNMRRHLSSDY